jgi:hypothetical protein
MHVFLFVNFCTSVRVCSVTLAIPRIQSFQEKTFSTLILIVSVHSVQSCILIQILMIKGRL